MDRHHEESRLDLGEELYTLSPYSPGAIRTRSIQSEVQTNSVSRRQPEPESPATARTASLIDVIHGDSGYKSRSDNNDNIKSQNDRKETIKLHSTGRVSRKRRKIRQGWRYGLTCATKAACAILLVNALTIIVAAICLHDKSDGGVVSLYTGSKSAVNACATSVHLLINALSALLLSGANYSMQCLASPTRSELDGAHRRRKRLDIGVPSARNLFGGISWERSIVWMVLLLSSLPIHTFYNAVVSATLNNNEFDAWVVNESFLNPNATVDELQSWALQVQLSNSSMNKPQHIASEVQRVHATFAQPTSNRSGQIQHLEEHACDRAYDFTHSIVFSDRSTVVLVTSEKGPYGNQSLIAYVNYMDLPDRLSLLGHQVDYCLSQVTKRSTLQLSFQLAGLVIACNLIIVLAMLWLLYRVKAEPLVTVGDALTSFLDSPDDQATSVSGPYPATDQATLDKRANHMAISRIRWTLGLAVILICFLMAGGFVGFGLSMGYSEDLAFGMDEPTAESYGVYFQIIADLLLGAGPSASGARNLFAGVLVANLPQLICSLFYLVYNGLLSSLLLAREWNQFYLRKQLLRVSDPKGQQRSTYYLQVPFRYGISLVLCSVALHWFVSQSIFVVFITTWNSSGEKVVTNSNDDDTVDTSITGFPQLFFSRLGLLLAAILSFLMIIALIWFGFQKLPGGMPIVGSNSRLIAAACHRPDDDEDAAYLPNSWGELVQDGGNGPGHCCFTSKEVRAPAWICEDALNRKRQAGGWMTRKCRSVCDNVSELVQSTPGLKHLVRRRAQRRELEQQAVWLYAGT